MKKPIFDDRDVEMRGSQLAGKIIDLVVTGGIASIETPKLIRELRRYGAEVRVFMTPAATEFVSPLVFEWASKNKVVVQLSGSAEHITHADAVLIAPATLDFISKIALGISDTAAATLVQSAIARLPVFFAPAMHLSLQGNPAFKRNLNALATIDGVQIVQPQFNESKAKMARIQSIAAEVCHTMSPSPLSEVPVLLTSGPTRSFADEIRYLSNRSSGKLGAAIADELFRRGADVSVISGPAQNPPADYIRTQFVETRKEMEEAVHADLKKRKPKIAIFSAAVLDFEIKKPRSGKTSSKVKDWSLELEPASKLIQTVPPKKGLIRVGFKLEVGISSEELRKKSKEWLSKNPCEILVANRLEDLHGDEKHIAHIYRMRDNQFYEAESKAEIAKTLADLFERELKT